jgi:hypothetical protein
MDCGLRFALGKNLQRKNKDTSMNQSTELIESFLRLSEDRRQRMTIMDIDAEYRSLHDVVLKAIHCTYGADRGMQFSKSIHPDGFGFFIQVVRQLKRLDRHINFLEIGSFEGVSMSVVALLLRKNCINGNFVSIDPYYEDGYREDHPVSGAYIKSSFIAKLGFNTPPLAAFLKLHYE